MSYSFFEAQQSMFDVFLQRAEQLSRARQLVEEKDERCAAAIALLSVHTAIALNDALLFKLSGKHTHTEDHMEAVREMRRRCSARRLDPKGIRQLEKLISAKSAVSYGAKAVTSDYAAGLSVAAQRFEAWTYLQFKELA
jgi:hypothetical protein